MLKTITLKLKQIFTRKKTSPIPFTEYSQPPKPEPKSKNEPVKKKHPPDKTDKRKPPQDKTQNKNQQKQLVKRNKPWNISQFQIPKEDGKLRFHDLPLSNSLMHAIADLEYKYCTPIQAGLLPETLTGKDAVGKAQTGTGKSAAFIISILSHFQKNPIKGGPQKGFPRALILAPTRELVVQIEKDIKQFSKYTPFRSISLYGGMGYEKQKQLLKTKSYDIVIATPGRLIDFNYQKLVNLSKIEILVLDEADRMLDMGFIPDVRKIVYKTPHKSKRQTMFYSATFSPEVSRLAEQWTKDSVKVEIEPETIASKSVEQIVYLATTEEKFRLLYNLLEKEKITKALVFTNRKDESRDLYNKLTSYDIESGILTGDVHQKKRISTLERFRNGNIRILVATDVAGRGIHIESISHVINYNLPHEPENYVHRIGRTGRAGESGISISFACEDDSFHIPSIEDYLGKKIECVYPEDSLLKELPEPKPQPEKKPTPKKPNQNNRKNYSKGQGQRKKPSSNYRRPNNRKKQANRPSQKKSSDQ